MALWSGFLPSVGSPFVEAPPSTRVDLALAGPLKNCVHLVLAWWIMSTPVSKRSFVPQEYQGQGPFPSEEDHVVHPLLFLLFTLCALTFFCTWCLVLSVHTMEKNKQGGLVVT